MREQRTGTRCAYLVFVLAFVLALVGPDREHVCADRRRSVVNRTESNRTRNTFARTVADRAGPASYSLQSRRWTVGGPMERFLAISKLSYFVLDFPHFTTYN